MSTIGYVEVFMGALCLFFAFASGKFRTGMVGQKNVRVIPTWLGRTGFVVGSLFLFYCAVRTKS